MPTYITSPKHSENPFLILASAFAAGVILAKYLPLSCMALAGVLAIASLCAYRFRDSIAGTALTAAAFIAAGGFCFAFEGGLVGADRLRELYDSGALASGQEVEIEGLLGAGPEPAYDGVFLDLAVEKIIREGEPAAAPGRVRLFVPINDEATVAQFNDLALSYGSRVRVSCNPLREEHFQNPGALSRKQMLDEQGIDATATVQSPLLIQGLNRPSTWIPVGALFDLRTRVIDTFRQELEPATAGVMIASLLGDKYFLDRRIAESFREGGTFHILVISGMHITFLGGLVLFAVSSFTRRRLIQFFVVAGILWAYTIAVGAEVPVVRASVVLTILLLARAIYRTGSMLNVLGACALLSLAYRPSSLFAPSFQLTFLSVGAMVGIAFPLIGKLRSIGAWMPDAAQPFPPMSRPLLRRFAETLYWRDALWDHESKRNIWSARLFKNPFIRLGDRRHLQRFTAYVFEALLVSLSIQVCLLPISIVYFHRVSFAGILLNLWAGIVLAAESFAAVAAVFVSIVSSALAQPLFHLAEMLNAALLFSTDIVSSTGPASMRLPAYTGAGKIIYFLYFVPIVIGAAALRRWDPFSLAARDGRMPLKPFILFASVVCLVLLTLFHPFISPTPDGRLHVDFLDVGQGDSALVTFPNGETMLVDAGGRVNFRSSGDGDRFERDVPGIGDAVVSEFLWERGYSRIDHIVATHADADHIQGLAEVARNFDTGSIIVADMPQGETEFSRLESAAADRGIPMMIASRGDVMEIGGVKIYVLWPEFDPTNPPSENDRSLVLRLEYGQRSMLLTGDIEKTAEAALIESGEIARADVIKVPHHGSRTSSTSGFVEAVRAKYAVISVGRRSVYGHPHPEVYRRWLDAGSKVLTTGMAGTISISTDGEDLDVATFVGPE